jgi:hypothetical protein
VTCPLGRDMAKPCPRKEPNGCFGCSEDLDERAAILEFGQGTGGSSERPTCATRQEAIAMAIRHVRESMPGQLTMEKKP